LLQFSYARGKRGDGQSAFRAPKSGEECRLRLPVRADDKRTMTSVKFANRGVWSLPPLILHPFSNATDPVRLLAGSRALASGPEETASRAHQPDHLQRKLLLAKYCEIRMLCCIGKDLTRWIEQCLDYAARRQELREAGIGFHSFATLLVETPPAAITDKFLSWGVRDFQGIFARAIGLSSIFAELPGLGILSDQFLRDYYGITHQLYISSQRASRFLKLDPAEWMFDVFTSGEYIKIIERQVSGR